MQQLRQKWCRCCRLCAGLGRKSRRWRNGGYSVIPNRIAGGGARGAQTGFTTGASSKVQIKHNSSVETSPSEPFMSHTYRCPACGCSSPVPEVAAARCPICRIAPAEFEIACGGCKQRSTGLVISSPGYCPHCGDRYLFVTPPALPKSEIAPSVLPHTNAVSATKSVFAAPTPQPAKAVSAVNPSTADQVKSAVAESANPIAHAEPPVNLLDRLKQQAAEKLASEAKKTGLGEEQRRTISNALSDTFSYLREFTNQVNTLKPDFPTRHFIGDQVRFDGLAWKEGFPDFRLVPGATDNRTFERVSLRYILARKEAIVIEREHPQIELFARTLSDHGLVATTQDFKNNLGRTVRTRFEIKPEVICSLVFVADYTTGSIRLSTRNVQRLGLEEYGIPLDALTNATMEDLALLVLGASKQFVQRFKRII